MKVIIKMTLAMGVLATGCVGFGDHGVDPFEGDGLPEEVDLCEGCLPQQELRGELMLLVNTKLTDVDANFTINYQLDGEGRYAGNALYLYDPARDCADGCMAKVGNLWLDDAMGPISVGDDSLRRFTVRDLAWHPERGVWGLSYDPLNDEWGLAVLDVPDWKRSDNRVGIVRYAFRYGPVDDPATDACYWRQSMTGLGFVGDQLYAGSAGKPGNGLDARGAVFLIDPEFVREPEHSVHPSDISMDPLYYASRSVCSEFTTFEEKIGVAGDLEEGPDGAVLALARGEGSETLPAGRNALYTLAPEAGATPAPYGPYVDDIMAGFDIEGLARVGGALYGVTTEGLVYRLGEPPPGETGGWKVEVHDDLAPSFTAAELSVRIRGATRIVVE